MTNFTILFAILILCICPLEALRCLRCEGDPKLCASKHTIIEDCGQFGPNTVCKSFFYYANGRPHVEKGCYQTTACKIQESRIDNQCGEYDGKDKPCRCCCNENGCNSPEKGCIVPSKCGFPKKPLIGKFDCPRKIQLGTVCNFTCPTGYDKIGSKITKCVRGPATGKLVWNPFGQRCTKIRCKPLTPLKNGQTICVNKPPYKNRSEFIYKGTVCSFKCNAGYKLIGARSTGCKGRTWSKPVPKCAKDPCNPFPKERNRIDSCTNGNMQGSICTFTCKRGYKLSGNKRSTCVLDHKDKRNKEWDRVPGRCVKIKCLPEQDDPRHGAVSCTNANFENSICTFTCKQGYDIIATAQSSTTTKCVDNNDGDSFGKWTHLPTICTRVQCKPKLTNPENGQISCTKSNFFGSVCTFVCNYGYDLEDSTQTKIRSECKDDGNGDSTGEWSFYPLPTCTKIKCMPPHKKTLNGKVSCSNSNYFGSVCKFTCNKGYDLEGTTSSIYKSKCEDDNDGDAFGKWSKNAPTCTRIECEPIRKTETLAVACSDKFNTGTVCKFQCKFGYELFGATNAECTDKDKDGDSKGEWSGEIPICKKIYCKEQKHDNTVVRKCDPEGTNRFQVDTVCAYKCAEEGYYMASIERRNVIVRSGTVKVRCLESSKWDRRAPRCIPVQCPPLNPPKNGYRPTCTNSIWLGSKCEYNCLPRYKLTHIEKLVCESDGTSGDKLGRWSRDPPKCEKNECEPFKRIRNGRITYWNDLKIGSVINLLCNSGYTYKQYEVSECLPPDDKHKLPFWNQTNNVCCVDCIFNTRLRIVSVLDKALVQNRKELADVMTWHYYLLEFLFTNGYDIKFSLVLYGEDVDGAYSLDERFITSTNDINDIRFEMIFFPFGGRGSDTSKALKYAKSTYLTRYTAVKTSRRPKEEPFIILLERNGRGNNAVETAKEIRKDGIHILGMTFKEGARKSEEKNLISITGAQDRVFMVGGITDLRKAGEAVTRISKEQGCSSSSRNQICS